MSDKQGKKRKKKAYYKNFKKQKFESKLDAGQKGFLITCNNNEKQAVREAYNLLNEYGDKIYGPEQASTAAATDSDDSCSEEDVEAAVAKEIASIRETATSKPRFRQRRSGANNVLFINTTVESPTDLIKAILTDVEACGKSKSRAILRMVPVESTCRAKPEDIKVAFQTMVERLLPKNDGVKYSVAYKARNSGVVDRQSVIDVVRDVMRDHNAKHRLDWHNYEILFNFDVIRTVCCIGVLKDYERFRKYNLQEIVAKQFKSVQTDHTDKVKSVQSDSEMTSRNVTDKTELPVILSEPTENAESDGINIPDGKNNEKSLISGETREKEKDDETIIPEGQSNEEQPVTSEEATENANDDGTTTNIPEGKDEEQQFSICM